MTLRRRRKSAAGSHPTSLHLVREETKRKRTSVYSVGLLCSCLSVCCREHPLGKTTSVWCVYTRSGQPNTTGLWKSSGGGNGVTEQGRAQGASVAYCRGWISSQKGLSGTWTLCFMLTHANCTQQPFLTELVRNTHSLKMNSLPACLP